MSNKYDEMIECKRGHLVPEYDLMLNEGECPLCQDEDEQMARDLAAIYGEEFNIWVEGMEETYKE